MRFLLSCLFFSIFLTTLTIEKSKAQENDFWINPSGGLYIDFVNWGDETSPGTLDTANFDLPNLYDVDWVANYSSVATLNVTSGNVLFRSPGSDIGGPTFTMGVSGDVNVNDSSFFIGFGDESHGLLLGGELNVDNGRMEVLGNSAIIVGGISSIGGGSIFAVGGSTMNAEGNVTFGTGSGGAVDDTLVQIEAGATLIVSGFIDVAANANTNVLMDVYEGSSVMVSGLGDTYIGTFLDSAGELVVRDTGTTWDSNNNIRVGFFGDGVLTIEDGGVVSGENVTIGDFGPSSGIVNVTGFSSELSASAVIRIGLDGVGVLTVEDEGFVSGENIIIGELGGSSGTVNVTGLFSALSASANIQVGPGSAGQVNISDSGALNSEGQIVVGPQGVIDIDQPGLQASISALGGLVNNGLIDLKIGAPIVFADVVNNATIRSTSGAISQIIGSLVHDGVEIFTTSGAAVRIANAASGTGPYTGTGTVCFDLDIEPGVGSGINSIASISFDGDVFQVASTITQIEIAGPATSQFDRLLIDGDLNVDGILNVYDFGHDFAAGDEFVIIEVGGTRTGEFDGLPEGAVVREVDGLDLLISYAAGDGNDIAVFVAGDGFLLGDVNLDGFVNLLDIAPFVALISSGVFQAEADINGDGFVNLLDVAGFVALLSAG